MKRLISQFTVALAIAVGSSLALPVVQAQTLPDFTQIIERADPAVVNIRTTSQAPARGPNGAPNPQDPQELFRWFFGPDFRPPGAPEPRSQPGPNQRRDGPQVPRGVGSGFFISADGFILTNHHVVDDAEEIYVTLLDKREFKARIVGSDARTDVALIKIDATNTPRLPIGDPNRLRKGEWVVAIGSPFGLESTVTAGIVSAKGRDTGDYLPFIQTDVAVNPGNSGGPLLNLRGEVVGINSQIISRSGGFMGISLAIPIDEAMQVADQLKANGRVIRGRIGVQIGEVSKEIAEAIGLGAPRGALIRGVEKGSPAERAGIEPGDVVLRVDGRQIEKWSDLPRTVGAYRPGTNATVELWRKGATRTVQVTVAETEPDRRAEAPTPAPAQPAQTNAAGLAVVDLTEAERTELRVRGGVKVTRAEGAAAAIGIREGDIILAVNTQDISSASQFNELVQRLDRSRVHGLLVRRGEASQWVPLRLAR